jgi:hypothetical protein
MSLLQQALEAFEQEQGEPDLPSQDNPEDDIPDLQCELPHSTSNYTA